MKIKLSGNESFLLSEEIKDTFDESSMDDQPSEDVDKLLISKWIFKEGIEYDLGGILRSISLTNNKEHQVLTVEFLAIYSQVEAIFRAILKTSMSKIELKILNSKIVLLDVNIQEKSYVANSNPEYAEVRIASIYSYE